MPFTFTIDKAEKVWDESGRPCYKCKGCDSWEDWGIPCCDPEDYETDEEDDYDEWICSEKEKCTGADDCKGCYAPKPAERTPEQKIAIINEFMPDNDEKRRIIDKIMREKEEEEICPRNEEDDWRLENPMECEDCGDDEAIAKKVEGKWKIKCPDCWSKEEEEPKCWTCDEKPATHSVYRDALNENELTCDECYSEEYPKE